MRSYKPTFACALTFISTISAASPQVGGLARRATSDSFPDIFPPISGSNVLNCKFGGSSVSGMTNPVELPVSQVASAPICFTSSSAPGSYILLMIDPDSTNPQTLHYMQPDMTSGSNSTSKNSTSSGTPLSASGPAAVKYLGPAPPAGSGLHRYTMFLFSQPDGFKLPGDVDTSDRSDFDIASFATEYKLGQPVGATFFVAQNSASGNVTNGPLTGNRTSFGNSTSPGSSHNGTTIMDLFRGNSTNGTLHGPSFRGNGTNGGNSTNIGGHRNGTSLFGGNSTTSSSSNSSSSSDRSGSSSSPTGPVPIPPTAVAQSSSSNGNTSTGGSSANFANFVLAGFVGMVTVGVIYL